MKKRLDVPIDNSKLLVHEPIHKNILKYRTIPNENKNYFEAKI